MASEDPRVKTTVPQREAVRHVPVIDISPFCAGGDRSRKAEIAGALRKACIDVGFFYLSGHGLPPGELDRAVGLAHRFFALPLDVKMRYLSRKSGGTGFVRIGGIDPSADAEQSADIKERFIMVRKTSTIAEEDACWPAEDVVPGFSDFMQGHISHRVDLARALARAFALSLHLPESYLDAYYETMAYNTMLNYYPPLTPAALARSQWSFSPHTDYGGFTLLSQDAIGGLQVRNAAGEWIDVPPREETFVVNIGDLTARWTNDLYTSTLHRASNVGGVARISIPFFASPHHAAIIRTLPTCVGDDNPAHYPDVTVGDYLRRLIDRADTTGRPGISARTAERLEVR
jgi:isopenicillin N synthase-like dioxygenase